MKSKVIMGIMLIVLLVCMLTLTFNIQPAKAGGTIYIRIDGSIDPPTANITSVDNVTYTFTGNIFNNSIVVERDDIILDGAGYTLQGTGSGTGINLPGRSNVTIKNTIIKNWTYGITTGYSSGITISNNTLTSNSGWAIVLGDHSSGNTISNNTVTSNSQGGILTVLHSNNNTVSGNEVALNGGTGIQAHNYSCYNTISNNTVTSNDQWGIILTYDSSGNTISNNTVTSNGENGILLSYHSSGNTVSDNTVASNWGTGILLYDHSGDNNVTGNIVNSNGVAGIATLLECHDNIIMGNRASNNSLIGIHLRISSGNTLRDNNMTGNKYNFGVWSDLERVSDYVQDIDTSNTVDGKPIYHWVNQHDRRIPADAGYVQAVNCVNITVEDLNLTKNGLGVMFVNTTDSTIRNLTTLNNQVGINLIFSSGNTINGSTITSLGYYRTWTDPFFGPPGWMPAWGIILGNSDSNTLSSNIIANNDNGITLVNSSGNTIYHNNFINNTVQANVTSGYVNTWDDSYPSGGNYWSNYNGTDQFSGLYQNKTGSDGIGDTPYVIPENNQDNYPLMNPWPSYLATVSVVPSTDVAIAGHSFTANITVSNVTDLYLWAFSISWNPTTLDLLDVTEGEFLQRGGSTTGVLIKEINQTGGYMKEATCSLLGSIPGVNGNGILATITFKATAVGSSPLDIYFCDLLNSTGESIPRCIIDSSVDIDAPDLSIVSVSLPYPDLSLYANTTVSANITIQNTGNVSASAFNVSLTAYWIEGAIVDYFEKITVESLEANMTLTLQFNFTLHYTGNYTLTFNLDCDNDVIELNETNNELNMTIKIKMQGDIDGDNEVTYLDLFDLSRAYWSTPEDTNWNKYADINNDGRVDYNDLFLLAQNYSE